MDEMGCARHGVLQAFGRGQGFLRMGGGLDGVDIEMVGAGMIRVPGENSFQGGEDLLRAGLRLAVGRPQVPGTEVHQGFGKEGMDVRILRKAFRHLPHGVGIALVQSPLRLGRGGRRIGIAVRQGLDEGLLHLRRLGGQRPRLLNRFEGGLGAVRLSRHVDVRPQGEGHAPPAARALGVQPGRLLEGPLGLFQVEGEHQPQPLVEVALGFGRLRGHGSMKGTESLVERGGLRSSLRRGMGVLRGGGKGDQYQRDSENDG